MLIKFELTDSIKPQYIKLTQNILILEDFESLNITNYS